MDVLQLTAIRYIQPMSTGRNHAVLLGCEDPAGEVVETVVKFRGSQMSGKAQTAELISAQLADDLGLQVPQAAVVNVPVGFEHSVPDSMPEEATIIRRSPGNNFGSVHLGAGFTTWLPGRNPVGAQRDQAAEIFAFDVLVQNGDRRTENPNLWSRSDRLGIYDHDQAFSFLYLPIIGGCPKPWSAASQGSRFDFLKHHVFYTALRAGRVDLGPFRERLAGLSDERLAAYSRSVPSDWAGEAEFTQQILAYLKEAREERKALVNFVKHLLR